MVRDANKGIVEVTYNEMNLPEVVDFGAWRRIEWRYAADGTKLRKTVYDFSGKISEKRYAGGYVYEDTTLAFFGFAGGRVRNYAGTLRYEYDLSDHLGNVRASFAAGGGGPTLLQRDDYYPFGLRFRSVVTGPENSYTYNGKEWEDAFGLHWYHYGVRFLDPQLGRWHAVDPLDVEHSPYNYSFNDPINFTDPDGAAPLDWIRNNETGEYIWDGNVTSAANTPEGYSYVGKFLSDVFTDFNSSLVLYDFWSEPTINFSGWPGEIGAYNIMDNVSMGYPGEGLPWWLDPSPGGKVKGAQKLLSSGDDIIRNAETFFDGAKYSAKVLRQMANKKDIRHAFPRKVDDLSTIYGRWSLELGDDGKVLYEWLRMPGSHKGVTGTFEYIKNSNGIINHRYFRPNN